MIDDTIEVGHAGQVLKRRALCRKLGGWRCTYIGALGCGECAFPRDSRKTMSDNVDGSKTVALQIHITNFEKTSV